MNPPQKSVGSVFDAALELPPEQRAAHLEQACAGDEALRQRVELLLKSLLNAQRKRAGSGPASGNP